MQDEALRARAVDELKRIIDPATGRDLVSSNMVQGLYAADGQIGFALEVPPWRGEKAEPLRAAAQAALARLPGVAQARVVLTAHHQAPGDDARPDAPDAPGGGRRRAGASPELLRQTAPRRPPAPALELPHIDAVIAVASGKGGVGKSTIAVNLACAMAAQGRATGLLDADIYGPSVPILLGLKDRPHVDKAGKIIPLDAWGLKAMSIGLMVDTDQPMIWRGPMIMGALTQMLGDVAWGSAAAPLDILVLDMPPGTGDAQLTIGQKIKLAGAILVSTPQEVALADVRRGARMFEQLDTPILGIIENMAWFEGPDGSRSHIFGQGGARATAEMLGVPFLGELPLDPKLREASDAGTPIVAARPESPMAAAFNTLAMQILDALDRRAAG